MEIDRERVAIAKEVHELSEELARQRNDNYAWLARNIDLVTERDRLKEELEELRVDFLAVFKEMCRRGKRVRHLEEVRARLIKKNWGRA
jgi:hypothetical protein